MRTTFLVAAALACITGTFSVTAFADEFRETPFSPKADTWAYANFGYKGGCCYAFAASEVAAYNHCQRLGLDHAVEGLYAKSARMSVGLVQGITAQMRDATELYNRMDHIRVLDVLAPFTVRNKIVSSIRQGSPCMVLLASNQFRHAIVCFAYLHSDKDDSWRFAVADSNRPQETRVITFVPGLGGTWTYPYDKGYWDGPVAVGACPSNDPVFDTIEAMLFPSGGSPANGTGGGTRTTGGEQQAQAFQLRTGQGVQSGMPGQTGFQRAAVLPFSGSDKDAVVSCNSHGHKTVIEVWTGRISPGDTEWWQTHELVAGSDGRGSAAQGATVSADPVLRWAGRAGEFTLLFPHWPDVCGCGAAGIDLDVEIGGNGSAAGTGGGAAEERMPEGVIRVPVPSAYTGSAKFMNGSIVSGRLEFVSQMSAHFILSIDGDVRYDQLVRFQYVGRANYRRFDDKDTRISFVQPRSKYTNVICGLNLEESHGYPTVLFVTLGLPNVIELVPGFNRALDSFGTSIRLNPTAQ